MSTALIANNIRELATGLKHSNTKNVKLQRQPSREQFIMAAMQGLLANPQVGLDADVVSSLAVSFGDATWEKTQENNKG